MKPNSNQLNIKAMKKVLLAIAVLAMIGFASCSKQKQCKCTGTLLGTEMSTEVTIDRGESCNDLESNYQWADIECHRVF